MKINPVSQLHQTIFQAGKTTIFTDFDGSYMPFKHADVCKGKFLSQINQKEIFNKIYHNYSNFLQKAKEDAQLIITTGRSKPEYEYIVNKIKRAGLFYQSPSKLITRDGNDCYNIENDNYVINNARKADIEKQSNWNRAKTEKDLKKLFNEKVRNVCIINAPINKNEQDYENLSLEHVIKSLPDTQKMYYLSFAKGDDLFLEIALSEHLDSDKILQLCQSYLKKNSIKAEAVLYKDDYGSCLPQYSAEEGLKLKSGKIIRISPKFNNEKITKINDVKQELEFNIKNNTNNLVVAIGDSSNDEVMLNPLNYLSIFGYTAMNNNDIFSNPELLNTLYQMPFASIIVGKNKDLDNLRMLGQKLEQHGIKKIYLCKDEKNGFLPQLKKAIYNYGEQNEEFKYSMNSDLFKEILSGGYIYDC